MKIDLYASMDRNGNVILYPEEPRYSEEAGGYVCRFGEFILPKSIYKKEAEAIAAEINNDITIIKVEVSIRGLK